MALRLDFEQCQIVLGIQKANIGPYPFGRTLWRTGVQYATNLGKYRTGDSFGTVSDYSAIETFGNCDVGIECGYFVGRPTGFLRKPHPPFGASACIKCGSAVCHTPGGFAYSVMG